MCGIRARTCVLNNLNTNIDEAELGTGLSRRPRPIGRNAARCEDPGQWSASLDRPLGLPRCWG
jgi:hypothetical protein